MRQAHTEVTVSLTAVVITLNEENNIEDCIRSVSWADEIVILDSGSTDRTPELARALGAAVSFAPFTDFATQKNLAISRAQGKWVLLLDADERATRGLQEEVKLLTSRGGQAVYEVGRKTFFFGRRLRFSGTQSDYPIRLFPRGNARFVQPVHESIETSLPVKRLQNALIHYSTRDFVQYRRKMNQYVAFELEVMAAKKRKVCWTDRWIRPALKFAFLYFWRLGILDGAAGLQYAALSSYYDYSKYKRYCERQSNNSPKA